MPTTRKKTPRPRRSATSRLAERAAQAMNDLRDAIPFTAGELRTRLTMQARWLTEYGAKGAAAAETYWIREAEELRSGIEHIIDEESESVRDKLANYEEDESVVTVRALRHLLDRVDARDSLKHLERKARKKKGKR